MKSFLDTKLVFKYSNTIVENSHAPLEAEGGVYGVPCLECSNKYYGAIVKSVNTRMSQHEYDVSRFKRFNVMYRHMFEKKSFH